jgi:hypothetical protein
VVCLFILLLTAVVMAPAETRLGNLVKLVYVHGALVWSGLLAFSIAGALGVLALIVRRPVWQRGVEAAALAALVVWILYVISAMVVTGLTWGQVVAWNEPRVRATALILLATLASYLAVRLVRQPSFTAATSVLLALAAWLAVKQADVIRHPQDPIGGSGSAAIQSFYLLIVVSTAGLTLALLAWLWIGALLRDTALPHAGPSEHSLPPAQV